MTRRKPKPPAPEHFVVALPDNLYISGFSYPMSSTKIDKAWEKSPGIRLAQCIKAILGPMPYRWGVQESAAHIAKRVGGAMVQIEYDAQWLPAPMVEVHGFTSNEEDDQESESRPKREKAASAAAGQASLFGEPK